MLLKNHTYFTGSFSTDNMDTVGILFQIATTSTTLEKEAYGIKMVVVVVVVMKESQLMIMVIDHSQSLLRRSILSPWVEQGFNVSDYT